MMSCTLQTYGHDNHNIIHRGKGDELSRQPTLKLLTNEYEEVWSVLNDWMNHCKLGADCIELSTKRADKSAGRPDIWGMPAGAAAHPPPSARLSRLDVELSRTPETVSLLLQSHCHHSVGNVRHQGCSIFRLREIFGHGIPNCSKSKLRTALLAHCIIFLFVLQLEYDASPSFSLSLSHNITLWFSIVHNIIKEETHEM